MIESSIFVGLALVGFVVARNYFRNKAQLTKAAIFLENADEFKDAHGEKWRNELDYYIIKGCGEDGFFSKYYKKTILKKQLERHQSSSGIRLYADMIGYKVKVYR